MDAADTMSVTNTLPDKVGLFPIRLATVHNPAIHFDHDGNICNDIEAEERSLCGNRSAFEHAAANGTHIAGILIEPMQGEGGDNHFRTNSCSPCGIRG